MLLDVFTKLFEGGAGYKIIGGDSNMNKKGKFAVKTESRE
jgi:hypothetical protein